MDLSIMAPVEVHRGKVRKCGRCHQVVWMMINTQLMDRDTCSDRIGTNDARSWLLEAGRHDQTP